MKRIGEILNNLFHNDKEIDIEKRDFAAKSGEFSIGATDLIEEYPPVFHNRYKSNLWERLYDSVSRGNCSLPSLPIIVSQYEGDSLETGFTHKIDTQVDSVDYYFDYKPSTRDVTRWYLNFADPNLFFAYGSDLFAQDEIQCLEHPLLGSIREYLVANTNHGVSPLTKSRDVPTPVLVENVPYMIDVHTSINVDGMRCSIYGNSFRATELCNPALLDKAICIKKEITTSNIIAMCAPYPEVGRYRAETIEYMLKCAFTSFGAARERSTSEIVEIHTGRWGAGAFGGNEELALLVQILASKLNGINKLVFHAVNESSLGNAIKICNEILTSDACKSSSMVELLYNLGYEWGTSDGN